MPLTKAQILANLSQLPLNKLELLDAYANFIIIPQEDLLTNVNMLQMRSKVFDLATQYFPDWTDQSPSDFGTFLAELFCLFSEKDFWYINAFANQTLLQKMSVYSIAFIRSIEMGYRPQLFRGADGSFQIDFVPGALFVYPIGDLVIELAGGLKFTNATPISVPLSLAPFSLNTTLRQGEYVRESASFNGRSVDVRKTKVDISTVSVEINGIPWSQVAVFGESGPTSLHYVVLPEESGRITIFFGEDGFGKTPLLGDTVEVTYFTTQGAEGNVNVLAATVKKDSPSRATSTSIMLSPSVNGVNGSTLAQLKYETTNFFNYRKAALNVASTTQWLKDQPEISKAFVAVVGNTIFYNFLTISGGVPTGPEQTVIQNRLSPLISVGFVCAYSNTTYVNVSPITVTVFYLTGGDPLEIVSLTKQIIQDYTDPLISSDYGKDFVRNDLIVQVLSKIAGTQNVTYQVVAGVAPADIVVQPNAIMSKIALANITVNTVAI